ncbi:hypothetical protein PSEUBRA_003641 [Kalmanozyma brasiliensis GHG001]|uniref:Uncharacterized protein n=1 Tax=Kalmanozyma brasiliensis (strain GHG001) TaxID=1365824 RepID=V5EUY5_KALBG|nr:uncharacterized protein PSEUBRA_003641 [Kalmanozyma brasiliensis GHG001]EST07008.1 hypothetical protein PSEUBRA_003641 [Kalmanozyma brasiliensis GHG001]
MVPQLLPPVRVNGHVPRDTLGTGRASSSDVVLTDVHGPLSLLLVPDPLDPTIATLVLSIGFTNANNLQGASRRFVLPFRSFQRDPVSGELVSRSKVTGFDAAHRQIYPGLGAGTKGLDGGSFWFFEDVGEEGAFDRYRWERDGVGRRAIWTVWLISTPSPVVQHLQDLLCSYPAPAPPLPRWLQERNGFPWQDRYLAVDNAVSAGEPDSTSQRPLPSIPLAAPEALKEETAAPLSSPVAKDEAIPIIARGLNRSVVLSEYRNSLVAVDNLTGQIAGVLASNIDLDPDAAESNLDEANTASSDGLESDADGAQEAQTPLDEHVRTLHDKCQDTALGLDATSPVLPRTDILPGDIDYNKDLPTPRPSTIVQRPASVYRDTPAPDSRPPSILADDTFSPPPLPPKRSTSVSADVPLSHRTSTTSAFFSVASDAGAASYDSDALEIHPRDITHASLISIRDQAARDVEKHRPELLRDLQVDDGEEGEVLGAAGSSVDGPVARVWRKAVQAKKRWSKAGPAAHVEDQPEPVVSQVSIRTSKAETALEASVDGEIACQSESTVVAAATAEADGPPTIKARSSNHLPRSTLRTDQVRCIEDGVWREALDNGHLPIDAPYTHLAARGGSALYPSSILSFPRSFADGSAIELLSAEDKARKAQKEKRKQSQRVERMMQGGTVLIEFLAGSSRIGASIIRSAGLNADAGDHGASKQVGPTGLLSYVPVLPQHLLAFFGLSTAIDRSETENKVADSSESAIAPFYSAYLPSLALPSMPDWLTSLFSFTASPSAAIEAADDPSDAEEWEYAIPDFDPNSLASTPRPVYRRKRPVPSAMNGFAISASAPSSSSKAANEVDKMAGKRQERAEAAAQNRYSIVHIDSLGVGRRAFLKGMPGIDGLPF